MKNKNITLTADKCKNGWLVYVKESHICSNMKEVKQLINRYDLKKVTKTCYEDNLGRLTKEVKYIFAEPVNKI